MRHEQIKATETYDRINIAAVWPVRADVAPAPIADDGAAPEEFAMVTAAPDVPASVGSLIVGAYGLLIAALALLTVRSDYGAYMVVVAALCASSLYLAPRFLLAQEPKAGRRPTLERFLAEGMDTLTGHSSGSAALVQMLIVPVLLTFAVAAIAVATAIAG